MASKLEFVTLGAGCFWGVEKSFRKKFPHLINLQVGYCGGLSNSTDYRSVCTGKTGHAEVIHFQYDPCKVGFDTLLDFFFRMHDPTTLHRQGADAGTQYRSAIFFHNERQKEEAQKSLAAANVHYKNKIATSIEEFKNYVKGEDYHQDYLTKNPHGYECPTHFERSWDKILSLY